MSSESGSLLGPDSDKPQNREIVSRSKLIERQNVL